MEENMRSLLRNRLGIPGVIAVIALVFAMVGGAWAAKKYVITSTNQIKPSVLKKLKGATGPAGLAGAAGPVGPVGPVGPQGIQGPAGTDGKAGATGATGKNGTTGLTGVTGTTGFAGATGATGTTGTNGPSGPTGSPWVPNNTLPSGAQLTGVWSFGAYKTGVSDPDPFHPLWIPISFPIALANDIAAANTHLVAKTGSDPNCPGTTDNPTAASGHLCLYTTNETEQWNGEGEPTGWLPGGGGLLGGTTPLYKAGDSGTEGSSTAGAVLKILALGPNAFAYGTWAVKAP
jgi:hypothetical protein